MKKCVLLFMTAGLLLSCGASKMQKETRKAINGNWVLNQISFPENSGNLKVQLFNTATAACFENSEWHFVSNNNTGTYQLSNPECDAGTESFKWSVKEVVKNDRFDLMLKPTNSKYKSTSGNQGFRLNITLLSQESMTWEQTLNFEGKPFTIRMNFNKK